MNSNFYLRATSLSLLLSCLGLAVFCQTPSVPNYLSSQPEQIAVDSRIGRPRTKIPSSPTPDEIIQNFVTAENGFRQALTQFSFKRNVLLQTIGPDRAVTGEYIRNSAFVLDDRGRLIENVFYHPKSTITEMTITKEDIQDLAGSQLFGLTDLTSYNLSYLGEENLEGVSAYVLAISPKQKPDPHHMRSRFFIGRIWLDRVSFQPIKLRGITEPSGKQRFPAFETIRSQVIENFFFPSSTLADDVLHFPNKDVHYRIKVRYYDFKRFASRVKIVELQ
ncbi:MAG: hypothetical protein ACXW18_00930 [Pyrinomonadaceae bacterium]